MASIHKNTANLWTILSYSDQIYYPFPLNYNCGHIITVISVIIVII